MTHTLEKLPSGFYGIKVVSTGVFWRSDLVKWDGKKGTGSYSYNVQDSSFRYYQDAENTVYYTGSDGGCYVWCSGKNLASHCHHLHQIAARR